MIMPSDCFFMASYGEKTAFLTGILLTTWFAVFCAQALKAEGMNQWIYVFICLLPFASSYFIWRQLDNP